MRRFATVFIAMAMVGLIVAPAQAREYDHFRFPRGLDIGDTPRMRVYDCHDGPNWEAKVVVTIRDRDRNFVARHIVDGADAPGDEYDSTTVLVRVPIDDATYDPGIYRVLVRCQHLFDDYRPVGTWFREGRVFRVRA